MPDQYRFGDFQLLPQERQLLRAGVPVPLTSRAFGVLVVLAERAGQLVSKDELMQKVWAGVVVEDNNIAVHVAQLRKALGPHAISTIAGCGYRFVLDVAAADHIDLPATEAADAPGNLPSRLPALIGRERELDELCALMAAHPLVMVCGGAGVGKTHLAMAAAQRLRERHADGVYWVDLTAMTDGAHIAPTITRLLGLKPAAGEEALAVLARRLKPLSLLLVLDNAEHLAEEVDRLASALVQGTRQVAMLVTSQVPLRGAGQRLFRLGPLGLPGQGATVEDAVRCGAMRLLAERAGAAGSPLAWDACSVDAAIEVCSQLDGNPLAIELAAARIPALGLAGLASRLQQRLGLLAPLPQVRPSRQNALSAALDWSHGLLSEHEQRVFRRLAVFHGTFELDGAALCMADEALSAPRAVETILDLVDRSLVSVDRSTGPRYRLLETGRLYAHEKLLASGEAPSVRRVFGRGMRQLFDEAYETYWQTPRDAWCTRWAPEIDSLRAALSEAAVSDPETAVALYASSWPLWDALCLQNEARAFADALVPLLKEALPKAVLARFWEAVSRCHTVEYPQRCRAAAELAAQLYGELGHSRGEYLAWAEYGFNWRVDNPDARRALERAQALENLRWPAIVIARGRTTQATLDYTSGRFEEARGMFQSVLDLCERDNYLEGVVRAGANLADVERAAGHIDQAVQLGEALLRRLQASRPSPDEFTVLGNLTGALLAQGNMERAREVVAECARRMRRVAEDSCMWSMLDVFALLHALDGRLSAAAQLTGASDRAYRVHGQHARQPNEAADRARVDRLLADQADAVHVAAWRLQGEALEMEEAMQLAFAGR